jgi:hypothetical protein
MFESISLYVAIGFIIGIAAYLISNTIPNKKYSYRVWTIVVLIWPVTLMLAGYFIIKSIYAQKEEK